MRKILFSLIMIAATVGIVASSAYALFTDTADVKGVSITSGNADLIVNYASNPNTWFTDVVYPGWTSGYSFSLKNQSASNIAFGLTGNLSAATGPWESYKGKISVALVEYGDQTSADNAITAKDPGQGATKNNGWVSLSDWNSSPKPFGTSIDKDSTHYFVFWMTISRDASSTDVNGTISTDWIITGTQI